MLIKLYSKLNIDFVMRKTQLHSIPSVLITIYFTKDCFYDPLFKPNIQNKLSNGRDQFDSNQDILAGRE